MWCLKFARADLPELKGNKAIKHEWQKNTEIVNLRAHFVWLATIKWKKTTTRLKFEIVSCNTKSMGAP